MARVSAQQVYSVISPHQLTDEQLAAVEGASLTAPTLVIAGAGSGKTELMTVRILYLVANGFARPEQILGLTFTKKAANELSARVLKALYALRESEFWPQELELDFSPPNISTYNSFGNEIFRQNALAVGYEPDSQVLTDSGSVALAKELLRTLNLQDLPELADWEKTADYLVQQLLAMSQEVTDNMATTEAAIELLSDFSSFVQSLPKSPGGSFERFAYTEQFLAEADQNRLILDLARRFQRLKQERNLVDFSDQVALALQAQLDSTALDYRFVMLDEYQDTSSIQIKLLSQLFRGKPVMAVGDPNQAIYGWRGASEASLTGFAEDFGTAEVIQLSTCWRSGYSIVESANLLAAPLAEQSKLTPVILKAVKPADPVQGAVYQTITEEAEAAAEFFKDRIDSQTSAALLMRTKAAMPQFVAALQESGLEVEVTGLSGLVELPEVIDLISALRVLGDPQASTELIRLLSGPRWAIAARDIAQLANFAKRLGRIRPEVNSAKPVTLVEALDELRKFKGDPGSFSEIGLKRLQAAAEQLHLMRTKLSLSLTELSWALVRELNIDIELFANSQNRNPLQHLEQFISRLTDYEATALRPSLGGLMQWLDYALEHESFELPKSGAKRGVVQVMSVHAAKGLEWDVVLVAQLNQGSFPVDSRDSRGWLAAGKLPFELRADQEALPKFNYRSAESQRELKQLFEQFQEQMRERQLREERRLAYVAATRASKTLRLTASYYKAGAKKPRAVSPFFLELIQAGQLALELPEPALENPMAELAVTESWPRSPEIDQQLQRGAELVTSADAVSPQQNTELALLLEERERRFSRPRPQLPRRLSASALVHLLADPQAFFEALRRPMPVPFSNAAREGTRFHLAIENYFSATDSSAWFEDDETEGVANFLGSRFSQLQPLMVEQQIEFVLGGFVVVCKLDAVFEQDGLYDVVDWKSGSVPGPIDLAARSVQLALYRIALARWLGVGQERIRASFFFAKDGQEVSPSDLPSEAELEKKLLDLRTVRLD